MNITNKEKNIYKEDIVSFAGRSGIVVKLAWDDDILDDTESEDESFEQTEQDIKKSKQKIKVKDENQVEEEKDEADEADEEIDDDEENDDDDDDDYDEDSFDEDGEYEDESDYDDDDDDDQEGDHNNHMFESENMDEFVDDYRFKNQETGVLISLFEASRLVEVSIDDVKLIDRTFYLTDEVQRIDAPEDSKLLGLVVETFKKFHVVPLKSINQKKTISEQDIVVVDRVHETYPFQMFQNVIDKKKNIAGQIRAVYCNVEAKDSSGETVVLRNITGETLKFNPIYQGVGLCVGLLFKYRSKEFEITKVTPVSVDIRWIYYFNDEASLPESMNVKDLDLFCDEYQIFNADEFVVFNRNNPKDDSPENLEGGYIYKTETSCKVLWQDGRETIEKSLDLMKAECLATDYFPGHTVCSVGFNIDEPYKSQDKKWGVIVDLKPTERTCTICWNNINHDLSTKERKDYFDKSREGQDYYIESDVSVYDIEYLEDYNFDGSDYVCKINESDILPEADVLGQVIGKEHCQLIVKWNNGFIEKVYPNNLSLVGDFDSDEEGEQDEQEEDEDEVTSISSDEENNSEFQNDIIDMEIDSSVVNNNNESTTANNSNSINNNENQQEGFAMVDQFENHNYLTENITLNKGLLLKIMKEFELLKTSLPSGIYVKGNNSKMNLLQALIIGPSDTIYENSIFIFDIFLPGNYPMVPPKVFFHSVTHKLHPNLNINGTVCLSLLGTWHGNKSESWIPKVSNLLQVLISIQGLILGSKEPYFLEAGYDTQIGTHIGVRNSSLYNEDSYLLSLEALVFYISNQPLLFKDIIIQHIQSKKIEILKRIDQFLDTSQHELKSLFHINLPPSEGFLSPLRKLRNKIDAFN
ncbi:hypothetical protein CYY_001022 [Polysphondylium violaceum]|uniref:UBC core domain-containing protein n=1 Tax=Polysphondylium violaceum TaxID=133409 RepID=A0A8J4Q1T7_9MYCE|nr:hypothetical protein CYY_001022 [Polysphondylium violaceum]